MARNESKTPTVQSNAERLDNMATWAAGVKEEIADLTAAMIVTTEERADSISLQLADLLSGRGAQSEQYREALEIKGQLGIDVAEIKERIGVLEAQATLDALGINPDTGKAFTVAQCDARAKIALANSEAYQAAVTDRRNKERDIARARATLELLDREAKEYGRAVDVLTARLNNLTARVQRR